MDTCVRNLARFTSLGLGPAIVCATRNPAEMLGGEWARRKGNLRPGADADLVLLDRDSGAVLKTWIMGKLVYSK
jgi:N-acetylglucosamine-6-phosphate deacetylase